MSNPQTDTIYKSYIDAYRAAAILKKQDVGVDTVVRIKKAPYGGGYVVRSTPVFLETSFPMLGKGMSGAPAWVTNRNPDYGEKK
ncbi:MAG: hypothetical protein OXU96_09290 [Gammaproteobacteria bacterium]|nr:hypothetical protein [Gammaproteobacteria bacterium]MDD9874556.1 hypothetical protein [Gammaproteobacteria bacterium]